MRKRFFSVIVTVILLLSAIPLMPVSAASVDDYTILLSNFNTEAVSNGPRMGLEVTIDGSQDVLVQSLTTYHWNYGNGKTPGYISIFEAGVQLGRWKATGRSGSGVNNVNWDVFPNFTMKAHHTYAIVDSDPETWSYNARSNYTGFCELRGKNINSSGGSSPFRDVPAGAYYHDPVVWAVNKGITKGADSTHFDPDNLCSRGMFVTFLWRAAGSPSVSGSNPFQDIRSSDYYYTAVLWAVKKGITQGTSSSTFSPNRACTRGQVVTFLFRYEGSPAVSVDSNPFRDVRYGQYYYAPVLWAVSRGITNGVTANRFAPDSPCIRADIVTFLYRDMK